MKSVFNVNGYLVCDRKRDRLATHAFIAFLAE